MLISRDTAISALMGAMGINITYLKELAIIGGLSFVGYYFLKK